MSDTKPVESLQSQEQPQLFDEKELPVGRELLWSDEKQRHQFTGEVVARNQAKYQAIIDALGEGLGVRQISRAFHVSHHTVIGIRERESNLVAAQKERTGIELRRLVSMATEAVQEALADRLIPAASLPVTLGILIDKSLTWDGQATAIVRHEHQIDQGKVLASFAELRAPILEAEVEASDSESGALALNPPQKENEQSQCVNDAVNHDLREPPTAAPAPSSG